MLTLNLPAAEIAPGSLADSPSPHGKAQAGEVSACLNTRATCHGTWAVPPGPQPREVGLSPPSPSCPQSAAGDTAPAAVAAQVSFHNSFLSKSEKSAKTWYRNTHLGSSSLTAFAFFRCSPCLAIDKSVLPQLWVTQEW